MFCHRIQFHRTRTARTPLNIARQTLRTLDTQSIVVIGIVEANGAYAIPHTGILYARTLAVAIHNKVIPETVLLTVMAASLIADTSQWTRDTG